jgi:hypothetical protein
MAGSWTPNRLHEADPGFRALAEDEWRDVRGERTWGRLGASQTPIPTFLILFDKV